MIHKHKYKDTSKLTIGYPRAVTGRAAPAPRALLFLYSFLQLTWARFDLFSANNRSRDSNPRVTRAGAFQEDSYAITKA